MAIRGNKPKPPSPGKKAAPKASLMVIAPAPSQKPTPNQVMNFVINALAHCSGYSASVITKDWVLGNPTTDPSGDKHPGAGLSQNGIDICFIPYLNQFITHFGSSNTVGPGGYTPAAKVSDVAADVGNRI